MRSLLLGAGLVTTVRVALDPVKRRELFEALARRFPIQELLDEIVLEAGVAPDADNKRQPGGPNAKPGPRTAAATKKPAATARKPAAKKQATGAKKQTAGATTRTTTEHPRRHASRRRGDSNGESKRKPPNRGTRA